MALWMVAGLVFSGGKKASSARFTVSVRVIRKFCSSNGVVFADMRRCFRTKRPCAQASPSDVGHHVFRITKSCGNARRGNLRDARQIVRSQLNLCGGDVFFEVSPPFRARNGYNITSLSEHPCQRQLRRFAMFFSSEFFYVVHEFQIFLEIFTLKPRRTVTVVVRRQIFRLLKSASQKSPA